jgi:hypothetical protein
MFGIPTEGPVHVFCDNQGVIKNKSIPESVLTKKHNAVNYHAHREAAAAKILVVGKEDGTSNLADRQSQGITGINFIQFLRKAQSNMHPTSDSELGTLNGVLWVSQRRNIGTCLREVSKYVPALLCCFGLVNGLTLDNLLTSG